MNCIYCGYFNEQPTRACGRCGAELPEPACQQCGTRVDWGETLCAQCENMSESADETPCPSCGSMNNVSAEYCTSCGTPMAVITQVSELARARDRRPLETWRVYGIETEMVGRDSELGELDDWLQRTLRDASPKVLGVTGETGIGKTRLLAEFQRHAEQEYPESVFMESACRSDSSSPFGLFARLFRNRYYIAEDEAPAAARQKFTAAVESILAGPDAERVARLAGRIVGIPFDEERGTETHRDTVDDVDQTSLDALVELVAADARANPVVMVLEDLQFASTQSLRLLDHLIRELRSAPVLFVLSWNPKDLYYDEFVESIPLDCEVALRPLSDDEVRTFVRQTLHKADSVPRPLVDRIVESAHGVPLSVEEMLRILISDGVIDTRSATWNIYEDRLEDVEFPSTVEETVRKRLDALTDEERSVLEMASCIGDTFWSGALRALYHLRVDREGDVGDYWSSETVDAQLDERIESLERKDMVRRQDDSALHGHTQYYFKHGIEREAIYGEIPSQTKQRYHRLIAQWLEREVDEPTDHAAERIAEHYDRGHSLDRAARMYVRAAECAQRRYANERATDLFTKGLRYLSDADMDLKLSAFHDLGSVYERRGEYDQALAYFREMLRYSWLLDDSAKAGAALDKIGRAYRGLGAYDDALEHFERALDLFWDVSDLRGVAGTLDDIGKIHWIRGTYDEALRYYVAGLELRREVDDPRSIALSLSNLGSLKLQRGDLDEAMDYYEEALELRRSIDDRQGVADSFNTLGALCLERGETESATTFFEEALEMAREIGHRVMEGTFLNNLGEAQLKSGNFERAEAILEEARDVAETSSEKRVLFDVYRNLGRVAIERGDSELAHQRIAEALRLADELDSDALRGLGRLTLADVHAAHARGGERSPTEDDAERNYRRAMELLREVGNRPKLGRCLSRYGDYLVDRGDVVQGRQNLERARDIFERLEIQKLRKATEEAIHRI